MAPIRTSQNSRRRSKLLIIRDERFVFKKVLWKDRKSIMWVKEKEEDYSTGKKAVFYKKFREINLRQSFCKSCVLIFSVKLEFCENFVKSISQYFMINFFPWNCLSFFTSNSRKFLQAWIFKLCGCHTWFHEIYVNQDNFKNQVEFT